MSHGITHRDNMISVKHVPWHGLGVVLERQPKSIDDALKKAGLTWKIIQQPIVLDEHVKAAASARTAGGRTEFHVPGFKANVRSDTGETLGVVTDTYTTIQNREALGFLEAVLGEARIETLGSCWGGKMVFATLELPEHVEVGGDLIRPFVCCSTWHDGTGALKAYTTPVRQVCANTVRMAQEAAQDTVTIRHIGDPSQQVANARAVLRMSIDYYKQFAKTGNRLASQKMTERHLAKVMDELYPTSDLGGRSLSNQQRRREAVMAIVSGASPTVGNAPGSKWAAWNAIVEVYDHGGQPRTPEGAFLRKAQDPDGFKRRALELVTAN